MQPFAAFGSALFVMLVAIVGPASATETDDLRVIAGCSAEHYRHSEGSATDLPDGRTLLVWSRFNGHKDRCGTLGDNGPATLVMAESRDVGRTWSAPTPLPVGTATLNIMQAAFIPVRDGLMLAFSVRMKEGRTSAKYAIDSTDGGTDLERAPEVVRRRRCE